MSFLGTVWVWFLLACPIVFVAGFVWIGRARELDEPVDGVPTYGIWLFMSLGSIGLLIVSGGLIFLAGMGHGADSSLITWIAFPVIIIGPIVYCVAAFRWMSKVRGLLKVQRSGKLRAP